MATEQLSLLSCYDRAYHGNHNKNITHLLNVKEVVVH